MHQLLHPFWLTVAVAIVFLAVASKEPPLA